MNAHLHERLSRSLLEEMAGGAWRSGQRFLSLRDIKRHWKVSEPTVRSSLRWLREKGLLEPSERRGYFLRREFQQKAQMLLRRNPVPAHRPPSPAWREAEPPRGSLGGKVALLLESGDPVVPREYDQFPEGLSPSVRRCAEAFARECGKLDFTVRYFPYDGGKETGAWIRSRLAEGGFAGAAAFCRSSHRMVRPMLEPLTEKELPVVIIYDDCQGLPVHSVNLNNVGLGCDALRELYRMGHRKITILSRKKPLKLHLARIKGCLLAQSEGECHDAKIKLLKIDLTTPPSRLVRRHFADRSARPTAVFACESRLLSKLAPVWKPLQLSVPGDLSVIMCSSKSALPEFDVEIDSMQLKVGAKLGRTAARQLHRIQTGEPLGKTVLLDVAYIKRGSVRSIPKQTAKRLSAQK